ncbi:hypothetical protein AS156_18675 [Bradyrhizobium macuxiense]|uniref:Electron transfer flavoprotein alpha/beta-subunit N-terminal domain-containing protein n=1 Tax=Bradyrhizobium macuxiense TaxID=1755647 RepID=A0A109JGK6_9BRAD|nr:hypothetical protein [Bradyrhizobium macuxiense]KWV48496.1 hypothetical protein AS156_18675 [Bradyrhizobium macuxiense]
MKIITFVKHVPSSGATPRIAVTKRGIEEEGLAYEANETDLYAIEEALYQRFVHQGTVTAVTIGPRRAQAALHVAYAKGVDHGIHVLTEGSHGTDTALNVAAAAEVVKKQGFDLIFTGIQADDDLQGLFGIALAEHLGIPVISAVTQVNVSADKKTAVVTRELGGGYKEEFEVDLPCLCTVQFGIRPVRYSSIMAIVKARSRKIESMSLEAMKIASRQASRMSIAELSYPENSGQCQMLDGAPAEAVRTLVANLVEKGVI